MRVQEKIDEFLARLEARGISVNTRDSYANSLADFRDAFRGPAVTPAALQRTVDRLADRYKPSSVHVRVSALRAFCEHLVQEGLLGSNPTRGLKLPRIPDGLPKALDQSVVDDALARAKALATDFEGVRNWAILELGYAAAAREGDLLSARIGDLDMDKRCLRVVGKGRMEAILFFGVPAHKALTAYLEWRARYAHCDRVFIKANGQPMVSLYPVTKKFSGVGPHVFFRHSAATHMLDRGADISTVSEVLRHKSLNTTRIYTRIAGQKLRCKYEEFHPRGK